MLVSGRQLTVYVVQDGAHLIGVYAAHADAEQALADYIAMFPRSKADPHIWQTVVYPEGSVRKAA